jgi:hypothetical protein
MHRPYHSQALEGKDLPGCDLPPIQQMTSSRHSSGRTIPRFAVLQPSIHAAALISHSDCPPCFLPISSRCRPARALSLIRASHEIVRAYGLRTFEKNIIIRIRTDADGLHGPDL